MNDLSTSTIELSVVIVSYNGRQYLPGCLTSLIGDVRGIAHEIIVIDNASTDGSVDLVRQTCPECIVVVNDRNVGFTRAINAGIKYARGEYVLLLNQDTRITREAVPTLLGRLKTDDAVGVIGPRFVGFDGSLQKSARAFPRFRHVWYDALLLSSIFKEHREFSSWRMGWFDHEHEREVDQPMGAAMMLRRSVIEEVGEFDELFPMFFSDVDYCRRLVSAGYRNMYFPGAVIEHAVGGSTKRRRYRWRIESHRSMYRYLRKYAHWYSRPMLWLTGIVLWLGLVPSLMVRVFRARDHQ